MTAMAKPLAMSLAFKLAQRSLFHDRLRLVATKNRPCGDFPYKDTEGKYHGDVILDFDYWAAIPSRS